MPFSATRTPPEKKRSSASSAPQRLIFWVDSVGGYLACLEPQITLGQAVPGGDADVALLGDLSTEHARIRRNAGFFRDTDDDPFEGAYDVVENEEIDLIGGHARVAWETSNLRVTSITAYEQNERSFIDNSDASPSYLITSTIWDRARQWSQEVRIDSQLGGDFEWNAGALFITESTKVDNIYRVAGIGLAFVPRQKYEQDFYHDVHVVWKNTDLLETDSGTTDV